MQSLVEKIVSRSTAHLTTRAESYDSASGERSMAKVVKAFNAITGQDVTEAEGWEFMSIIKQVRLFTNTNQVHIDSYEDNIAYATLLAESLEKYGFSGDVSGE